DPNRGTTALRPLMGRSSSRRGRREFAPVLVRMEGRALMASGSAITNAQRNWLGGPARSGPTATPWSGDGPSADDQQGEVWDEVERDDQDLVEQDGPIRDRVELLGRDAIPPPHEPILPPVRQQHQQAPERQNPVIDD